MNIRHVVAYLASEVQRQKADATHVLYMYDAYEFTLCLANPHFWTGEVNERHIRVIAGLVLGEEGELAKYRRTPATFGQGRPALHWNLIQEQMDKLLDHQTEILVDEFILEFLKIHPFKDGNGRTASLLWNLLNGTINRPLPLPKYDFT